MSVAACQNVKNDTTSPPTIPTKAAMPTRTLARGSRQPQSGSTFGLMKNDCTTPQTRPRSAWWRKQSVGRPSSDPLSSLRCGRSKALSDRTFQDTQGGAQGRLGHDREAILEV